MPQKFIDRINNPQNYGVINNPDGSISTHRMAAEIAEDGRVFAFPTIVQDGDNLHQFKDPYEAMRWNREHNNAIEFDSIEEALDYSKTYKTPEFEQYYEGQRQAQKKSPVQPVNNDPVVVDLPNGSSVEFPRGMSASDISAVLFSHSQPGQLLHKVFNPQALEPYRAGAAEMALDVLPVTGEVRSAERLQGLAGEVTGEGASPIRRVLATGEAALEGAGLAAGVIPGLKAAGGAVGVNALMGDEAQAAPDPVAQQVDRLEGIVKTLKAKDTSQVTGLKFIRNKDGYADSVELIRGK